MENIVNLTEFLIEQKEISENILVRISKIEEQISGLGCEEEAVSTRERAANFIGCDAQHIDTLIGEGRIINYGRGRFYMFKKSELLDVRKIRVQNEGD